MKCVLRNLVLLALALVTKQDDVKPLQLDQRGTSENTTESFKTFRQSRIMGGTEAPKHSYPWQAALVVDRILLCGGSLISEYYVLTAGSCTSQAKKMLVILGAHYIDQAEYTTQKIWSASVTTHPDYRDSFTGRVNDIGVVLLSTPATLNSYVRVVPLANSRSGSFNSVSATLSGWGATSYFSSRISSALRTVKLTTTRNIICQILADFTIIRSTNICTYGCGGWAGDTGGALISNGVQIGIFSSGGICALAMPSIFTRVSEYEDWIYYNTDI
ncbi:brachyurin-like isoform X2 [Aethina tumida]|uniref:brachyurin-like isoform X2 n=1 Tax=Aethina tumida TaxID=116153 RepID=UPI002147FB89|nr:brachyurin-like isoform X2 [Aethina tumida]